MIELRPTVCNICGGEVIFTDNARIYGRPYGSGKMYLCTNCGARVGTHEPRPDEAYGILSNEEMRTLKKKCHELFDLKWKDSEPRERRKKRNKAYKKLAKQLGISVEDCHFGFFDMDMLRKAYEILSAETQQ